MAARKRSAKSDKTSRRAVARRSSRRRDGAKLTTYELAIQLTNKSGLDIAEFWMGHNPGSNEAPSTMYHFKISTTVRPLANNAVFKFPDPITLASGKNDKWLFYWRPLINNDLVGLDKQWFDAEVKHQNGTVNLNLNAIGGNLDVQQNNKTSKGQKTVLLQEPLTNLSTDFFASASYGTTIDNMFKQVGVAPPTSPYGLGICLSGGGTRAMCAGMGQLQALATIKFNGKSLLSQVKALSSVSGGGWVSAPYIFLKGAVTDADFLNAYVEPGKLTTKSSQPPQSVTTLPKKNIGQAVTSGHFSLIDIAVEFLTLLYTTHRDSRYSRSLIWQTIVGAHFLRPYDLYINGGYWRPATTYSYSPKVFEHYPDDIAIAPANYYANMIDSSRPQRPFHICNMAMKVHDQRGVFASLAAATPLYTGMFGNSQAAKTVNGIPIGNGGIATFAFNSTTNQKGASPGNMFEIRQIRQWGLSDSVGVSSAFLAAAVWVYVKELSLEQIYMLLAERGPKAARFLDDVIPDYIRAELEALDQPPGPGKSEDVLPVVLIALIVYELVQALRTEGDETVPHYFYWPPISSASQWPPADDPNILPGTLMTEFADGGLLENLGLASLFSYEDISSALVFVNTAQPLEAGPAGVGVNGPNGPAPNTNIKVDDSISALFGYMPYDDTKGYQLFPANTSGEKLQIRCAATAQIFAPADFPALLQGLWQHAGGASAQHPAICEQRLVLQQNALFNIRGGRTVKVMWFYLNPVADWKTKLDRDVADLLDGPGFENFPNYDTMLDTELTVPQYTLLANLAAWTVTRAPLADFLK